MSLQDALYYPCFNYRAVAIYRMKNQDDRATLLSTVANLMKTFEQPAYNSNVLKVLVAINPNHVSSQLQAASIPTNFTEQIGPDLFKNEPGDVLIQINAETTTARTYALRFCAAVLEPIANIELEITGEKDTFQSDPFGFYQASASSPATTVNTRCDISGALAGCSWLLAQQYDLNISSFIRRSDSAQYMSMGALFTDTMRFTGSSTAPSSAHKNVMASVANQLMRRGFSYRANGKEGLQFIACTNNISVFAMAFADARSKSDQVFSYTSAIRGGLYFVPNNSAFLDATASPITPTLSTNEADILRNLLTPSGGSPVEAVDYTVSKPFLSYIAEVKRLNAFLGIPGSMVIGTTVRSKLDEIHRYLARTDLSSSVIPTIASTTPTIPNINEYNLADYTNLEKFLNSAIAEANRINGLTGNYMTLA